MKKKIAAVMMTMVLGMAVTACGQQGSAGAEQTGSVEASVTGGYEDNFAVDESAVVEFGTKIKDAVAAKDLEALADLTSFPVYVGFTDQSETPETREAFTALGADRIFTQELMDSVAGAELAGQQPSMAGFVAASGDGPNIIFGVVDGELAITGFNY